MIEAGPEPGRDTEEHAHGGERAMKRGVGKRIFALLLVLALTLAAAGCQSAGETSASQPSDGGAQTAASSAPAEEEAPSVSASVSEEAEPDAAAEETDSDKSSALTAGEKAAETEAEKAAETEAEKAAETEAESAEAEKIAALESKIADLESKMTELDRAESRLESAQSAAEAEDDSVYEDDVIETYAEGDVYEDESYTDKESVALYIALYGHLPYNYITKAEAEDLGWSGGSLEPYAPGMSIGGSRFGNYEGLLPKASGRVYYECDIDYDGGRRNAKRLVYSNDGLIFYTDDHYNTFEQMY